MKRSVKIITGVFAGIMLMFTLYQVIIGNPFDDPIPPILIYIAFLIMAVIAIFAIVKSKKENKSQSK